MAPNLIRTGSRGPEERRMRRKLIKHLVEKKRRGRINQCLEDLRCLVLEAMHRKPEQYEKMEKADILEMTVRYLRHSRRSPGTSAPPSVPTEQQQAGAAIKTEPGSPSNNNHAYQFYSGYRACVSEISTFLESNTLPQELKQRLLGNIKRGSERLSSGVQQPTSHQSSRVPAMYNMPAPGYQCCMTSPAEASPSTMDIQCTLSVATPSAPKHFSARVVSSATPTTTKANDFHHHQHQQCLSASPLLRTPASSAQFNMDTPSNAYKSHFSVQSPSVSFALSSPLWRPW